jgi:hypothetical protein
MLLHEWILGSHEVLFLVFPIGEVAPVVVRIAILMIAFVVTCLLCVGITPDLVRRGLGCLPPLFTRPCYLGTALRNGLFFSAAAAQEAPGAGQRGDRCR